jgi:hypothetical protein
MGIAAYNRGSAVWVRRFQEEAEAERFALDSLSAMVAGEKAAERCRDINAHLAAVAGHRGVRLAHAQAALSSNVGQIRLHKYQDACETYRNAKPGRPTWFAACSMKRRGEHLMQWISV